MTSARAGTDSSADLAGANATGVPAGVRSESKYKKIPATRTKMTSAINPVIRRVGIRPSNQITPDCEPTRNGK
jgi:hypothetical protein